MKNISILSLIPLVICFGAQTSHTSAQNRPEDANQRATKIGDYTAGKNTAFYYSGGDQIAAFLFLPEDYEEGKTYPTIIINPPASGVKEQTAGLYAEELSKKGYVTLAFDPRGFGESEGIKGLQDAYRIADDIKAGISFLSTLPMVDKERLYDMGICAGVGYAAYATAFDPRVKKFIGVSPFLTSSLDFYESVGGATNLRNRVMPVGAAAYQKFYETGENTFTTIVPTTEEEAKTARPIQKGMMEYYLPGQTGRLPHMAKPAQPAVRAFNAGIFGIRFHQVF